MVGEGLYDPVGFGLAERDLLNIVCLCESGHRRKHEHNEN
jgi:hypothetical protein